MRLHFSPGTCSLSPQIILREAGLPFTLDRLQRGPQKLTEGGLDFLAINPKGQVPTLVLDDGTVLTEGAVIVQYLADQVPERGLAPPPGSLERYKLQEWLNFIAAEVHKGFSPMFNPKLPAEWRAVVVTNLENKLGFVAERLGKHDYLMGDRFSVADAYLYTVLRWAPGRVDLARWPAIVAYMARVETRPSVQASLEAEAAARPKIN